MRYFLGIDGGGTKTTALILDDTQTERGRGSGGPGNIATGDDATLRTSLRQAILSACQNASLDFAAVSFEAVCAGVAGWSVPERREAYRALLQTCVSAHQYRVEPDYIIAYYGASHGEPGIVIIAGTGAVAYGRNASGETCKEDGLGYLLGDRGSGFNLGLRVLRYALERMESGRQDSLSEAIANHTGAKSPGEMMQWLYGNFRPERVASLAPLVGQMAEQGDPAARAQVAEMARRLRHSVRHIRHKLWLPRNTPVYPLGGLWQMGAFFRSEFAEPHWLGEGEFIMPPETLAGGRFELALPRSDAVTGAALLAQQAMALPILSETSFPKTVPENAQGF